MKITKVCCQGCGASLDVDESLRFVTCNYCHAKLEVVHDPSTTHTKILEKIDRQTDRLAGEVKVLQLQNDLEQLNREWDHYRDSAMIRGKNGGLAEPSIARSVIGGIAAITFGILFATIARSAPLPFFLLGGVVVVIGLFSMISGIARAQAFNDAQTAYESKKDSLQGRIERARR